MNSRIQSTLRYAARSGLPALLLPLMVLLLVSIAVPAAAQPPTLNDFGFQCFTRDGVVAQGGHPLLLILANYEGTDTLKYSTDHYQNLVFGRNSRHSLSGYVYENSNQTFWWEPAAVSPVRVSMPDTATFPVLKATYPDSVYEELWFTYILQEVMDQGLFPFQDFDADGDSLIEFGELGILILASDPGLGLTRVPFTVNGPDVDLGWNLVAAAQQIPDEGNEIGFNVMVHEAMHILVMRDIYGDCNLNASLSIAGGSSGVLDAIYHLDPRHKMNYGWISPILADIRTAGSATLVAPQSIHTPGMGTLLLYDSQGSLDEYFMLEYRTPTSPWDDEYDQYVAGDGVVLWHIWTEGEGNCWPRSVDFTCDPGDHAYGYLAEGAPDLTPGGNQVWGPGQTTPPLLLYDPAKPREMPVRVTVGSFNPGDGSVQVSWTPIDHVWVDFAYSGVELGTFDQPFNTVQEGVDASNPGGYVYFKAGSTPETLTITKAVTLVPNRGTTTIGQP